MRRTGAGTRAPRPGRWPPRPLRAFPSGHHGDLWLDLDALFLTPTALQPYAAALADLLRPYAPDAVCGPLVGGAYAAQQVALALPADFCWTDAADLPLAHHLTGRRVAIVDDAINAGTAVTTTAAALSAAGAELVAVAALLTLGSAPRTLAGTSVLSLATLPSTLWPATTCPRCAAGHPLDTP